MPVIEQRSGLGLAQSTSVVTAPMTRSSDACTHAACLQPVHLRGNVWSNATRHMNDTVDEGELIMVSGFALKKGRSQP